LARVLYDLDRQRHGEQLRALAVQFSVLWMAHERALSVMPPAAAVR